LAIVNCAAINMVCILTYILLDICPRVVLQDHMLVLFLIFLRNHYTNLQSGGTNLHSHQQCIKFPFPLHPHQYLVLVFLMIIILTGVRWILKVILICISFTTRDSSCIYWLFLLLLRTVCSIHLCIYLLDLLIGLFFLLEFSFLSHLCILVLNLLTDE
jgi:hypothetical protein